MVPRMPQKFYSDNSEKFFVIHIFDETYLTKKVLTSFVNYVYRIFFELLTVFPLGCLSYDGPHEDICIRSVQREAGLPLGSWNDPSNFSLEMQKKVDSFDLR